MTFCSEKENLEKTPNAIRTPNNNTAGRKRIAKTHESEIYRVRKSLPDRPPFF
jgi:hypothetical protein